MSDTTGAAAYPYPNEPMVPQFRSRIAWAQALFAIFVAAGAMALASHATSPHAIALMIVLPAALAIILAFAPSPRHPTSRVTKHLFVIATALSVFAGPWLPALIACAPLGLIAGMAIGAWLPKQERA